MKEEVWKVIAEHPDYEVSSAGRVRRATPGRATRPGRLRKLKIDAKGYHRVAFCVDGRGPQHTPGVHRLVLTAFDRSPLPGEQANHIDGNKANNDITNLEWVTSFENARHAVATGLRVSLKGEQHPRAKLTETIVRRIRRSTARNDVLAAELGVSPQLISEIKRRNIWTHVEDEEVL